MKPDKFSEIIKNKQTFTAAKSLTASKDEEKFKTKLIKLLQAAYCDEWLAVYQYSIEADYLNKLNYQGHLSDKAYNQIVKELNIHTQEEFNHAKLIVPELILLNSEPIYQIDMLQLTANAPLAIPEKDHNKILFQALEAEETAIKVYQTIIDLVEDTKYVSKKFEDTLKFILHQEYEHRNDLDKLIYQFKEKDKK